MVPVLQRRHHRHVVGFEHIKPGREHIRQLAFMHKYRCLTFADRQLGTVFDCMAFALKTHDHRIAGIIGPVDDVDEFAFEKIENAQGVPSHGCFPRCSNPLVLKPEGSPLGGRFCQFQAEFPRKTGQRIARLPGFFNADARD